MESRPATDQARVIVGRRGLLRFGTLLSALTGASVATTFSASATYAAPGDKNPPSAYVPVAEKGSPLGVATLDPNAKIPSTQLPDLSQTYGSYSVLATPERFPGIDPTGETDSATGLQAAIDAVPEGGTVIVPLGNYAIGARIFKSGKSFTIQAFGARFIKTVNDALFDFHGSYEPPMTVSSLNPATITDDTAGSTLGTAITVESGPTGWVRGDIVKVYGDDVIPGGRPGSRGMEARVGQFLIVSNVTGDVINCLGTLDDPYSTNIRVAKLTNKAVHIRGGIFATDPLGLTGSWTTNMIQFRSMIGPTVRDVQIESTSYTGFRFTGCYGYTVDSCEVNYARNDNAGGINGYGVQDSSSSYGRVTNYRARRVRHAYTDSSPFIAGTADPANYGRSFGTRISNSVAYGTANTAWDTHSWSQNITFSDVQAVSSYKAFNARGRKHKFIDCSAIKCEAGGLCITNEVAGGESWGHYVKDFYAEDVPVRAIEANLNPAGSVSAGLRETRQSTINGATILAGGQDSIYILNASVRLDGLRFTAATTLPSQEKFASV